MSKENKIANKHRKRVKLIFNPKSGANDKSPAQLMEVLYELQALHVMPDIFLMQPGCNLDQVVSDAVAEDIGLFCVCGGDGTISAATKALMGTNAALGIIPIGTQNNVALSLGVPADISEAVSVMLTGKRTKVDVGVVTVDGTQTPFLELCSLGLFSALFPHGDDIQHGNILKIGDFLSTLTSFSSSQIRIIMDDAQEVTGLGHVVIISNMPYVGQHYQVGEQHAYCDGLLDVSIFNDLSKIDLIGSVLKKTGTDTLDDPRIQNYRVKKVLIDARPKMQVMADGIALGEGMAKVEIRPGALTVMLK